MFIWRGFGAAVVGIAFASLLLTEIGVERMFADDSYYQGNGWPKLLGLTVGAVLVWLLSNQLAKQPARIVIDKQTGQELTLAPKHDLFFVPLKYWPAILVIAGVAFMLFG